MKKVILSVAALLAFAVTAQAQEFKFGAKAGVNFATLGGDVEEASTLTGFHVGGVAEFKMTENFSLQGEVLYSMQGAKRDVVGTDVIAGIPVTFAGEEKDKLSYINVPILAKYYIMEGLSLEAGPQVGFLVKAESEYETTASGGGFTESDSGTADIKDVRNSIDFGLVGGIAYDLPMGLFFQARYNAGLMNINDDTDSDDYKITNNVFSLSVGYKF